MTERKRNAKRPLTAEDRRLWEEVRRSVKPLEPARPDESGEVSLNTTAETPPAPDTSHAVLRENARKSHQPLPPWQPPPQKAAPRRPVPLDDKTVRKLKKGRLSIDARIDLHGMAEYQAHHALNRFIENARREDHRIVLVITGKGERSGGILRRAVPRWLAEPPLAGMVGSWREAHLSHGGEGALYLRLRRLVISGRERR